MTKRGDFLKKLTKKQLLKKFVRFSKRKCLVFSDIFFLFIIVGWEAVRIIVSSTFWQKLSAALPFFTEYHQTRHVLCIVPGLFPDSENYQ